MMKIKITYYSRKKETNMKDKKDLDKTFRN